MNDRIRQLQKEIEREESKIENCKHVFEKSFFNPETVKEPYGFHYEGHGSDPYLVPDGYRDVKKDRWTRKCTICGKEEHTTKLKPIISDFEPSF
jgi:hypothetical protein